MNKIHDSDHSDSSEEHNQELLLSELVTLPFVEPTLGLEDLNHPRRVSLGEHTWKKWEQTLEKIVPAVLALRINLVRSFDTERSSSTQATGFIVDATRGIILTNRHVISSGPITAEAIFH